MKIPIACTLTVDDAGDRVEEWRSFFAIHASEVAFDRPTRMSVRIADDDASLLAAADLAAREKACCGFFSFSIDITADGRWLRAAVPEDAGPVLADFYALAQRAVETASPRTR